MKRTLFGLSLAATFLSSSVLAQGRLPTNVVPIAYDIHVEPNATKLTFAGRETIAIQVVKPTRTITVNAADLAISAVRINGQLAGTVALDAGAQTATFTFPKALPVGRHSLSLSFSGKIYETASGLFAVDYTNTDGSKDRMLATQFEAPDARRFAPMWDEPGIKATFKLTAISPAGQLAFSNMPVVSKIATGNKVEWRFAQSPKMSSYLLFLGMGNLERKTMKAGAVEIGVISRKGVVDQGDYALASAARLLPYYNAYFGTPYPLPKMDMIAVPGTSQFFSAMENWGAITYFESYLLQDPRLQTEGQKQDIHNVVAHEMAHQWFGNLVTMNWWEDLWLNEGFASWMATKASNDLNPEWGAMAQNIAFDRQGAISRDARATTHPIIQPVRTVDEISQAFDAITYSKGEAVIRMLEGAVGADPFREGVRRYMAKYKYANTVTDQLWAEVSSAAGRDVKPMMGSFTRQGGVPLMTANVTGDSVSLSQGRFGLDAASKAPQSWMVPVPVSRVGMQAAQKQTVSVSSAAPRTVSVPGQGAIIINHGQSGYFRTLYDDAHFAALTASFANLDLDDQLGLLADAYGLANSDDTKIGRYLSLLEKVSPDSSPLVWALAAGQMRGIDTMLTDAPQQAAFRTRARSLLAPVVARVGWDAKPNEPSRDAILREAIIPALGSFGDPGVVEQATLYAEKSFANPDAVSGAVRQSALSIYAYNADAARWDALRSRARDEKSPVAKQQMYARLGAVRDPVLAQRALALTLTDELPVPVRASVIRAVAGQHPAMAFDWAVANEKAVNAMLEASSRSEFIVGLPTASGDPELAKRVIAYAERVLPVGSRRPAETTAAIISYRAGLRARQADAIGAWAGAAR